MDAERRKEKIKQICRKEHEKYSKQPFCISCLTDLAEKAVREEQNQELEKALESCLIFRDRWINEKLKFKASVEKALPCLWKGQHFYYGVQDNSCIESRPVRDSLTDLIWCDNCKLRKKILEMI